MLHKPLEENLLKGYDYPVSLVVEVTKQGVTLSKLRYLKTIGQLVNETIRCPIIEIYCHMGNQIDPHLDKDHGRPMGIDWIFKFDLDNKIFRKTVESLRREEAQLNLRNPMTRETGLKLLRKIEKYSSINYKRLNPFEQGLMLEPYCRMVFEMAGTGHQTVLQNVEIINRESNLVVHKPKEQSVIYYPQPSPTVEIDLLIITEIDEVHTILDGILKLGFKRD
ncbi:MAG: hypothetical protein QCI38_02705 [Candidatus Thermoplasmatota archaeon]|nr:hypothetical protein [Candidatus Thermoplasmatota archaeon]